MAAEPDCIKVTVPAGSAHLHLVRLNAAGVAGGLDFSIEEIEDLKLAVEELSSWLLEQVGDDELHLELRPAQNGIRLEGWRTGVEGSDATLDEFRASIVGAIVDGHEIVREGARLGFRLEKRRA
ncbi:MAG: hypothetical protein AAF548_11945 [Actinomycetota bacterium]